MTNQTSTDRKTREPCPHHIQRCSVGKHCCGELERAALKTPSSSSSHTRLFHWVFHLFVSGSFRHRCSCRYQWQTCSGGGIKSRFFTSFSSDQTTFACFRNCSPSVSLWLISLQQSLTAFLFTTKQYYLSALPLTHKHLITFFTGIFFFFFSNVSHCSVPLVRGLIVLTFSIHEVLCIDHGWK